MVLQYFILLLGIVFFQPVNGPEITSPESGQALQGVIVISGSTNLPDFQSVEIAFAYDTDDDGPWFILFESQEAVERGEIGEWDTTTITDGNYQLRLRVYLEGREPVEMRVRGLRVRNYLPVETATPEPTPIVMDITSTLPAPTRTVVLTPTPLPPNPATVTQQNILTSFVQGLGVTLALFGAFGLYLALKRLFQRRR